MAKRWAPRWDDEDDGFGMTPNQKPPDKNPTPFDIFTRVILPLAIGVAGIFGGKDHPSLLAGFVVLALVIIYFQSLSGFVRSLRDKAHDDRLADASMKRLRRFSKEAEDFLQPSTSRSDLIPGIVQEIRNRNTGIAIQCAPVTIFHEHWTFLDKRIQHEDMDAAAFQEAVKEFTNLLSNYSSHCIYSVFQTFAVDVLRNSLSAADKGKLNGFQQRWVTFAHSYSKWVTEVSDEFRSIPPLYASFPLPDPLS